LRRTYQEKAPLLRRQQAEQAKGIGSWFIFRLNGFDADCEEAGEGAMSGHSVAVCAGGRGKGGIVKVKRKSGYFGKT
jgi:hypothetical protein